MNNNNNSNNTVVVFFSINLVARKWKFQSVNRPIYLQLFYLNNGSTFIVVKFIVITHLLFHFFFFVLPWTQKYPWLSFVQQWFRLFVIFFFFLCNVCLSNCVQGSLNSLYFYVEKQIFLFSLLLNSSMLFSSILFYFKAQI